MKPLSKHFHAFFIDIIGMGCSSREPYRVKNANESVDYFVKFVEEWRRIKDITNFFMCGHSLGGYMATIYAIKYPQHVKKLFLISPVGFSEKPKDFDIKRLEVVTTLDENGNEIQNKGPPQFAMHYIWPILWDRRITMLDCVRRMGQTLTFDIISAYVSEKLNPDNDELKQEVLVEFLFQLSQFPSSTEEVLYDLFEIGCFPLFPVIEKIKKLGKPISFVFGDKDWMDSTGAEVIITAVS